MVFRQKSYNLCRACGSLGYRFGYILWSLAHSREINARSRALYRTEFGVRFGQEVICVYTCRKQGGYLSYGRFGFSDVLTAFLALDTFVELYDGGIIRLSEFVNRKPDRDILVSIIIRKGKRKFRYSSVRRTKTDFPVIACAVVTGIVHGEESWYFSVGARPMKAALTERKWQLNPDETEEAIAAYAKEIAAEFDYGTNMRGSAEYRQHLAEVLLRRSISSMLTEDK